MRIAMLIVVLLGLAGCGCSYYACSCECDRTGGYDVTPVRQCGGSEDDALRAVKAVCDSYASDSCVASCSPTEAP